MYQLQLFVATMLKSIDVNVKLLPRVSPMHVILQ